MNDVLITGARSKIVQPVINYFVNAGWRLHLLTRSSQPKQHPSVCTYQVELSQGCSLDCNPEIIIHAAGVVPYNHATPISDSQLFRSNVYGYMSLLNFAVERRVKKVIFISSTDVYGQPGDGAAINEETACTPDNFYGFTKLACERISATYQHVQSLDITILRLGPVFGPGMNQSLTIFRLLSRALRGIEIDLVNPDSILSLVSVPDAADAIIKSCFAPSDIINIAGPPLSLKVFFERAYEARGFRPNLVLKYDKASEMRLRFDLNKASRVLGWSPATDFAGVFRDMGSTLAC